MKIYSHTLGNAKAKVTSVWWWPYIPVFCKNRKRLQPCDLPLETFREKEEWKMKDHFPDFWITWCEQAVSASLSRGSSSKCCTQYWSSTLGKFTQLYLPTWNWLQVFKDLYYLTEVTCRSIFISDFAKRLNSVFSRMHILASISMSLMIFN